MPLPASCCTGRRLRLAKPLRPEMPTGSGTSVRCFGVPLAQVGLAKVDRAAVDKAVQGGGTQRTRCLLHGLGLREGGTVHVAEP